MHLQLAYLFRYMSAVEEMLTRARRGDIGHIYEFRARLPKDFLLYDEHVATLGQYNGGIFFEMAGHAIDFMCSILGKPREIKPILGHHHPTVGGDFVDNGVALFGFDKAVGIVEVPALEITPDQRRIEVYGTEGAMIIPHPGSGHLGNNPYQPLDVLKKGATTWERFNLPAAVLQIRDLREFAAVVKGEKKPNLHARPRFDRARNADDGERHGVNGIFHHGGTEKEKKKVAETLISANRTLIQNVWISVSISEITRSPFLPCVLCASVVKNQAFLRRIRVAFYSGFVG